jgi:hypothetical protein
MSSGKGEERGREESNTKYGIGSACIKLVVVVAGGVIWKADDASHKVSQPSTQVARKILQKLLFGMNDSISVHRMQ